MQTLIKAILSGLMIGFGGIVYLCCPDKIIGSFLFAFGLLTIIGRDLYLYTGKIGYVRTVGWRVIMITLLGNFIGTFIMGGLFQLTDIPVQNMVDYTDTPVGHFIRSIGCGAMMYLAVDTFKKSKSWLFVIMPIMIFILCGFEHSIALMFYISFYSGWELGSFMHVLLVIIGNALGSWIFSIDRQS